MVYDVAEKITIPTLIVHGDADTIVPIEQSRKTAKLIPNCKLIEMPGEDHGFDGDWDTMINYFVQFVKEQI